MQNVGLDEAQAVIRLQGEITIISDADDTTLMAESKEELKSVLMKVKEGSEKIALKLNSKKTKILASGPVTSWQMEEEKVEAVTDFIFLGSKITEDGDCHHEIKNACSLEEKP